ncbi:MAG: alpha/beta fold hydrolase [Myxococcales bacterium]|nr:alpha/beta fold hydrolase [Myxococcales bacterium]
MTMRAAYLHGFLGTPAVWDGIARETDRRVLLPGHGGAPVATTWAANLHAVARAVAGTEVVVGYSLGARVALGLVAEGYHSCAVLISVNPGIDDAERPARRASDAAWARRFRDEPLADVLDAWEAQPVFAGRPFRARRAERLALDPEQLARNLEVMGLAEMPDYRLSVDGRSHVIAGARDAKFVAIARTLHAPITIIADAGHDPTLDQPGELARVLRSLGA